jgi:hypothetical protein
MKKFLLCVMLLGAAFRAEAVDYTGLWFNSAESGYGFNLVQSDYYIFATFFIYGQNGTPIWYSTGLDWDGNGHFVGAINSTNGTYFAAPWDPASFTGGPVGVATFTPSTTNAYQGILTLQVNGAPTVTKSIERQTLTTINLAGAYNGGESGTYSGCAIPSNNFSFVDRYDLQVTQVNTGRATFVFNFARGGSCTIDGALEMHGQQYLVRSASYTCSDGLNTTAAMSEIKATSLGIEGRFAAAVAGGCTESVNFSAVLN